MVLGVALHAALVYSTQGAWVVSDADRSPVFDAAYRVIHAFRMPAFFALSGLLCAESLARGGAGRLARDRTVRLLVPLAATAALLNPVQAVLTNGPGWWGAYTGGRWCGHLWFLPVLLAYISLAAGAWAVVPRLFPARPPRLGVAAILALPAATAAVRWACDRWLFPEVALAGGPSLNDLLYYLPFFAFGAVYRPGRDAGDLRRLAAWAGALLAAAVALPLDRLEGGKLYADAAVSWAATILCLYAGRAVLDRPWRAARALADASYTVYLLHHLVVVAAALALARSDVPVGAKFAAVCAAGFALPYLAHVWLVRPRPWVRFLFNGRWPRHAPPTMGRGEVAG
jgi:glucan biosynthesis protein C